MKTSFLSCVFGAATLFILAGCGGGGGSSSSTPVVTSPPPPPPPATNTAPTVSNANANQAGQSGQSFSYDATQSGGTFSDADGDTLTYRVTYLIHLTLP